MKSLLLTAAAVTLLASCATTGSDSNVESSSKATLPDIDCADIIYDATVTDQFPEIGKACQGVVRNSAGAAFVKVNAKVSNVRRNLRDRSVNRVTLDMLDAGGNSLQKVSARPPRNFRYTVKGEEQTVDTMARGQELRIYFPTDRWEVAWDVDSATPLDTKVYIEDIETFLVTSNMEADDAFEFDSAELSESGKADLKAVVDVAGDYVPSITIFGYTDYLGDDDYNLNLSQQRADAARDYLVSLGVPERRISAMGRGEDNPVVVCENLSGDALIACLQPNRRAEVVFLVPAVADFATVQVTKTYVKPLGESVTVTEELGVAQLEEASAPAADVLDSCSAEIASYCNETQAGGGRVLGCLVANKQAGHEYSARCDGSLVTIVDAVLFRRTRMNAVGSACSAEIAACDAAPIGQKLQCVEVKPKSDGCAAAMALLSTAAF